jgi:Cu(I)/Ag(I) efflux system membrane fusion protein
MPLVRARDLGYVNAATAGDEKALVIPASAPLITGKRAVVYVQKPGRDGVFEGREVLLGPRAGDYYIVKSGLQEGEIIVVNGSFKIDSAIQILAKPSMMNPLGGQSSGSHQHNMRSVSKTEMAASENNQSNKVSGIFLQQMDNVYSSYFSMQYALSHDQLVEAKQNAKIMLNYLDEMNHDLLTVDLQNWWINNLNEMKNSNLAITRAQNLEDARFDFKILSSIMITISKRVGSSGMQPVLQYHCPMAFDYNGADWLQNKEGTENPYFGSKMFKCGTLEAILTYGSEISSGGLRNE